MRIRLVRRPGQPGTRAYVEQYGDRLICVRYRYDEAARRRYKTVELIVDEQPWAPQGRAVKKMKAHTLVGVRPDPADRESYHRLRRSRATWEPKLGVWRLRYDLAVALGLTERIVGTIEELTSDR